MSLKKTGRRRLPRRGGAVLLSITLAWSGTAWGAVKPVAFAAGPSVDSKANPLVKSNRALPGMPTPEELRIALQAAEVLEREIPRDTFDPEAVTRSLDGSSTKIFDWIRDATSWVPYRGALRGPVGVLMDRQGNSLDRSLLLAELLRCAGRTVRLARARLADERAQDVVRAAARAARPRATSSAGARTAQPDEEIASLARAFQLDPIRLRAAHQEARARQDGLVVELSERVAAQTPFLADAIGEPRATDVSDDKAVAAAADHWWVQSREDGRWVDLDPLLSSVQPNATQPAADETFPFDQPSGRIPVSRDHAQELSIRVIIEQWASGRLEEKTALEHRFRPAEAFGQPIVLQHLPREWPDAAALVAERDSAEAQITTVLKQKEWRPVLTIGSRAVRQSSFTDTGDLSDEPGRTADHARGGGASALMGGFDALGGEDPEPETGQLTAAWIEYATHIPGESARVVRRDVFDLVDARTRKGEPVSDPVIEDPQRTHRALSLMGRIQILPMVCRLSRPYVQAQLLRELRQNHRALIEMTVKDAAGDLPGALHQAERLNPSEEQLLMLGLLRFEWSWVNSEVYLDAPGIVSYRSSVINDPVNSLVTRQGIDIVSNAVAVNPDSRLSPFYTRFVQGIIDTNVESLLVDGAQSVNAGSLLGTVPDTKGWVTLRQATDLPAAGVGWSKELRKQIERSLRAGFVVVAPRQLQNTERQGGSAFWVVDPLSGDTLGMGHLGWGQSLVEYGAAVAAVPSVWLGVCLLAIPRNQVLSAAQPLLNECAGLWLAPWEIAVRIYMNNLPPPPPPPPPPFLGGSGRCAGRICR
jgi:hypothetical protein